MPYIKPCYCYGNVSIYTHAIPPFLLPPSKSKFHGHVLDEVYSTQEAGTEERRQGEDERKRNNGCSAKGKALSSLAVPIPRTIIIKILTSRREKKTGDQKVPDKSNPSGQSENKLKGPL